MADASEAGESLVRKEPEINLLCENALINAYVEQQCPIPAALIEEAARELQFDEWKPVAPRVRSISPPASSMDLHSVLAKIQEDAEIRLTETTRANLHVVDTPQPVTSVPAAFTSREEPALAASVPDKRVSHVASAGRRKSRISAYGIASTRGRRFVSVNLAAAREFYGQLDLRSKMPVAVEVIRALQLQQKTRTFASRVRTAARPAVSRFVKASGPEWKARAVAARNLSLKGASSVRQWCLQTFTQQAYGKSFAASAIVAALLYLVARRNESSTSLATPRPAHPEFRGIAAVRCFGSGGRHNSDSGAP